MRRFLFSAAVIVGGVFGSLVPATATPLAMSDLNSQSTEAALVEEIGWRRDTGVTAILAVCVLSSRVWVLWVSTRVRLLSARV